MPGLPSLRRPADAIAPQWRRSPLLRQLRRPAVYWTAVALLLIVTVLGISRQSDRQQQLTEAYGELREVPVAARLIRAGEPLDDEAVVRTLRPASAVPEGALTTLPEGAVAAAAIYAGEVVHAERLVGASGGGLSSRLAPGTAAVSVPTTYGVPAVKPGDRVDLIAVFSSLGAETAPEARLVAHLGSVVAVDEDSVTVAIATAEVPPTVAALVWGTVTVVAVAEPAPSG